MFTRSITRRLQAPELSAGLKVVFALLIGAEIYASLIQVDDSGVDIPHMDKLVHFAMHWFNICFAAIIFINTRSYLIAGVLLFLLGPAIELLQGMLPYREASLADQMANTMGFLAGLLTAKFLLRQDSVSIAVGITNSGS